MHNSGNRVGPPRIRRWLLGVVTSHLLICAAFAVFQHDLLYHPPRRTAEQADRAARGAGLDRWYNPDGQAIGMKRLAPGQPAAGRVLVVYGNGSWAAGCAHYADDIQGAAALDVFDPRQVLAQS